MTKRRPFWYVLIKNVQASLFQWEPFFRWDVKLNNDLKLWLVFQATIGNWKLRIANWWRKLELSQLGLLTADWSVFKFHINKNQTYLLNNILWLCIWHLWQRPNCVSFNFYHMATIPYLPVTNRKELNVFPWTKDLRD